MKIKVLSLLVTTTLSANGAILNTSLIDQLTGLKGTFNERKILTESIPPGKISQFPLMAGKYQHLWALAPGPHLPIFFHYWGRSPAQSLAQSIQKALPATAGTPTKPHVIVR